jgi:hypothetical protein
MIYAVLLKLDWIVLSRFRFEGIGLLLTLYMHLNDIFVAWLCIGLLMACQYAIRFCDEGQSHRFGLTPDVSILTLCLPEPTSSGSSPCLVNFSLPQSQTHNSLMPPGWWTTCRSSADFHLCGPWLLLSQCPLPVITSLGEAAGKCFVFLVWLVSRRGDLV